MNFSSPSQGNHGQPPYQKPTSPQLQYANDPTLQQFNILQDSIHIIQTNQILYDISRPSKKSHFSLSEKPAITIGRSDMSSPMGTVRAHTMSETVDLTIHGRATAIEMEPLLGERWDYASIAGSGSTFSWKEDQGLGLGLGDEDSLWILKDAKHGGNVIAELRDDILTFKMAGLSQATMDEVLVSAVGMGEVMKRKKKEEKVALKVITKVVLGA